MVANHFRSALPLGSSKNGWYGIFGVSGRAVGTRYTAADNRVPKGTLSLHILDPAIKMAGYHSCVPMVASDQRSSDHAPLGPAALSHRPRSGRLPRQEGRAGTKSASGLIKKQNKTPKTK